MQHACPRCAWGARLVHTVSNRNASLGLTYCRHSDSVSMTAMKLATRAVGIALLIAAFGPYATRARAQNGSIEFVARATPSGGLDEPVRGFPFYLLSKSFEQITRDVEASYPAPEMDHFIDQLDVSGELKAWMKKNHSVQLSGEDFIHKLTPADVLHVPEFYSAYMRRNAGEDSLDFPKPKYKASDKTKDPAKYARLSDEYHQAIQRYIEQNPQSKDGMDLELADKNPDSQWQALASKRNPEIRRQAVELAQSKYLIARTETNLQGQGFLSGIAPGEYWLSSLDVSADVGDVRPLWDVAVTVRPGATAYVVLSNVNAVHARATP